MASQKQAISKPPGFSTFAFYQFWRAALRAVFFPATKFHVLHGSRSAEPGAWILAANHISHFDPPLLSIAARRPIDWMAMDDLFQNRLFGWMLRSVGTFPVSRGKPDRASLRTAVERLRAGRVVGIFPEGGIRDGDASILREASPRPGLSLVAALAPAPVRPVVIFGSDRLYNRRRWHRWKSTHIWIGFGDLVAPPDGKSRARDDWEIHYLTALRSLARETSQHFSLTPRDWPHSPAERVAER